jgi:hypothetical protein
MLFGEDSESRFDSVLRKATEDGAASASGALFLTRSLRGTSLIRITMESFRTWLRSVLLFALRIWTELTQLRLWFKATKGILARGRSFQNCFFTFSRCSMSWMFPKFVDSCSENGRKEIHIISKYRRCFSPLSKQWKLRLIIIIGECFTKFLDNVFWLFLCLLWHLIDIGKFWAFDFVAGAALDDGRQLQEAARPARLFMIVGHVESSFVPECSTSRAQKALTLTRN